MLIKPRSTFSKDVELESSKKALTVEEKSHMRKSLLKVARPILKKISKLWNQEENLLNE